MKTDTTDDGWRDQDAGACNKPGLRASRAAASHHPRRLSGWVSKRQCKIRSRFPEHAPYSSSPIRPSICQENENAIPRAALAASGTPAWLDRPTASKDRPWRLRARERCSHSQISRSAMCTHGKPSSAADNAILVLTAIGSIHHRLDFLIGPGRPLDPEHHFIICADAIGNGMTTSPSNCRTHPDLAFPRFTIRDMVQSQQKLLDALGIGQLAAVVGASMGGMQALQWGVSAPDRMRSIVALVPMARTRPWAAAMNEVARRILTSDAGWPSGPYGAGFDAWAAQSRVITNRTPPCTRDRYPSAMCQRWSPMPSRWRAAPAPIRSTGCIKVLPMMRTTSGLRPDSTATPLPRCDRFGRRRCSWFRNWTSIIRLRMRSRPRRRFQTPRWFDSWEMLGTRSLPTVRRNSPMSARRSANFWRGTPAEPKRNREAAAPLALLDSAGWQDHFRCSSAAACNEKEILGGYE